MKKILITGAFGRVGKTLIAGLKNVDYELQLCDLIDAIGEPIKHKIYRMNILDFEALLEVTKGIDCIVHLAGIPDEDKWNNLLETNISGTYNIFEAARINKVPRVIFASSNRIISFYSKNRIVDTTVPPRPDGLYGVTKVFGETLGRLYADKYGISVACIRIGSFEEKPKNIRHLSTWISARDLVHVFRQCIDTPSYQFLIIYGVSDNTRSKWDNSGSEIIDYKPQDNAEIYADTLLNPLEKPHSEKFHGGNFCLDGFEGDIARLEDG